tara:strand:- start:1917 stop:2723 length:807 start_codon:yes stop_codon:yes gene_type:complete
MKRLIIGLLLCFITATHVAWADTTSSGATTNAQTNTSGSNTAITGGYSQETTTTYQSGSSSNTTTTNTTNAYTGDQRVVNSSSAPSMSAMSQDLCVVGMSGGVSTFGVGVSAGTYRTDENCERIKLSKVLNDLGMKVAAVSILCQDPRVFFAMEQSGTPCPFEGKIGSEASKQWQKYDKLRPDYDVYVSRLKVVEKANKIEEAKLEEQRLEQLKIVQEKKAALELEMKQKKAEEASFNKLNNPDMKGMVDVKDDNKVKLGTDFNTSGR